MAAQDALVVPTVFDADARSVSEIAATTRALADRVRSGEVTPPELSGGTFTVSNLGMYGVIELHRRDQPAAGGDPRRRRDGGARRPPRRRDRRARQVMPVTLACDHRILYGADAARFLARIRELLEHPVALLL